jgi:hypothetical protein
MHTTKYNNGKIIFNHNGGYDGDVIITDLNDEQEIRIDMKFLREFVADSIRMKLISKLEQASSDDILERNL